MNRRQQSRIESIVKQPIARVTALAGGMISQVLKIEFPNDDALVAKIGDATHDLRIEGFMLRYLRQKSSLPVPELYHEEADLLLMEYIEGATEWDSASLAQLGHLLANCHQIGADCYGLERDTLIGPLHQPNEQSDSWIEFFREHRLQYMIGVARESGHLPPRLQGRLAEFADQIERYLIEPQNPVLIHGDMWRTNVIARDGNIAGIIDPALYYAHNEMELAYMTLFDGVGREFFAAYRQILPIENAFFDTRRHVYNLYPLLVHLTIFGAKYLGPLDATLRRFSI
ncbi:MAG: fructosamine kinase family protein [Chloroflexota bacterium]|nr:fructosamine kinase family protein [Chloroflexota bacterium]